MTLEHYAYKIFKFGFVPVAQGIERLPPEQKVVGSIPIGYVMQKPLCSLYLLGNGGLFCFLIAPVAATLALVDGYYRTANRLESIKNLTHQGVNEIVTTATIDEMIGDTAEYQKKLCKVSLLAEILGIETEITTVSIDLKVSGEDGESRYH